MDFATYIERAVKAHTESLLEDLDWDEIGNEVVESLVEAELDYDIKSAVVDELYSRAKHEISFESEIRQTIEDFCNEADFHL